MRLVAVLADRPGLCAVEGPNGGLPCGEAPDLDGELLVAAGAVRALGGRLHTEHRLADCDVRPGDQRFVHGDRAPVVAHTERPLGQGDLHGAPGGHRPLPWCPPRAVHPRAAWPAPRPSGRDQRAWGRLARAGVDSCSAARSPWLRARGGPSPCGTVLAAPTMLASSPSPFHIGAVLVHSGVDGHPRLLPSSRRLSHPYRTLVTTIGHPGRIPPRKDAPAPAAQVMTCRCLPTAPRAAPPRAEIGRAHV